MDNLILLLFTALALVAVTRGYGFDSGSDQGACGKPLRSARTMQKPPCDLAKQSYCTSAGKMYPWHAVRRFIRENQGLMRRMYGDERHLVVLKAEMDNDVDEDFDDDDDEDDGGGGNVPAPPPPPTMTSMLYRHRHPNEDLYHNGDAKTRYAKQEHLLFDDNELFDEARYIRRQQQAQQAQQQQQQQQHYDRGREEAVLNTKFVYSQDVLHQVPKFTQKLALKDADVDDNVKMANVEAPGNMEDRPPLNASDPSAASSTATEELTTIPTTTTTTTTTSTATSSSVTPSSSSASITTASSTDAVESTTIKLTADDELLRTSSLKPAYETSGTSADYEEETTTPESYGEPTESVDTKRPQGEMLFQDFPEPDKAPPKDNFNYSNKLRGVNACPVKEEVVAPFWANNTRGEVLALLNLYPFEQYVHWEKCTFEHRQMYCREGCRCEQQYRLHRLLAYDPNNECRGIFSDWFRFPSCCVCKCYDMPAEFRVTSRSPRSKKDEQRAEKPSTWFAKKKLNMKRFT